ncbi:MAG: phasin family protein [Alphaproteobacteria bacterium]|nr:phasin family protein [Alphaproteobacteria bacterium]
MLTVEQVAALNKANLDVFFGLTEKTFEGVEKLTQLNLAAGKAALNESAAHAQALLNVKDVQQFVALQSEALQPVGEKVSSYSRHVYDITAGTQAEFTKAVEAQLADAHKAVLNMVDAAAKNAPVGSESAVALFKTAVSASNNAYESVQKVVKQATQAAEANLQAVAQNAVNTTKATTARKR